MFMHTAEHVQEYVVGQRCSLVVFSSNLIRDNLKGLDRDVIMTQNVNYHVQMLIALVRNYGSLKNTIGEMIWRPNFDFVRRFFVLFVT